MIKTKLTKRLIVLAFAAFSIAFGSTPVQAHEGVTVKADGSIDIGLNANNTPHNIKSHQDGSLSVSIAGKIYRIDANGIATLNGQPLVAQGSTSPVSEQPKPNPGNSARCRAADQIRQRFLAAGVRLERRINLSAEIAASVDAYAKVQNRQSPAYVAAKADASAKHQASLQALAAYRQTALANPNTVKLTDVCANLKAHATSAKELLKNLRVAVKAEEAATLQLIVTVKSAPKQPEKKIITDNFTVLRGLAKHNQPTACTQSVPPSCQYKAAANSKVEIYDTNFKLVAVSATDAGGNYGTTSVAPGEYRLRVSSWSQLNLYYKATVRQGNNQYSFGGDLQQQDKITGPPAGGTTRQ